MNEAITIGTGRIGPRRVIIESPLAGDYEANRAYALDCMRDSIKRGESPYASHVLLPLVLDDTNESQRELGIALGFAWGELADARVFYIDRGVSRGMRLGYAEATRLGQTIEVRVLNRATVTDAELALLAGL
jgi:hypothetical protein